MKPVFSHYSFERDYLRYHYETKVLEIFTTYSWESYAGNGVSELQFRF